MKKKFKVLSSIVIVFVIFIISALLVLTRLDIFIINGNSMNPTFSDGDKITSWKKRKMSIKVGDIIIIKEKPYFKDKSNYFIKRVIATEGETIAFAYNEKFVLSLFKKVNNEWTIINESFIKEDMNEKCFANCTIYRAKEDITDGITINDASFFVLGDNRNFSIDSRTVGQIKKEHIINYLSM